MTVRLLAAAICLALVSVCTAADPDRATLRAVDLRETSPESSTLMLEIQGEFDRVETMIFEDGRFVFDLSPVAWEGPLRRERPGVFGVREYRFSQLSRDPLVTRFVVEVGAGWSCRYERIPRGLEVICGASPTPVAPSSLEGGEDIAVVRGIGLASPVAGLDAEGLIDRSLAFVPRDMVRDGLPNFGSMRDDWLGSPRRHKGLDIYGDKVSLQAAADGRVVGRGLGEKAGGWIKISHGSGVETVYVHISKMSVRPGDSVAKSQLIAVVDGPSGNAIQAQLHFELKIDGQSVDPVPYILEAASNDLKLRITRAIERLVVLENERASRIGRDIK